MELTHLHTFIAVAEEKNITRAAKRLYSTPSAISMQIKALEDELHIQLFTRTSRGVALTEKGELLKAKAEQTIQAARDFIHCAQEMQTRVLGHITVGLNASARFLRIPSLIAAVSAQHPALELHFPHSYSGQILEDLNTERLDAGFVFGVVDDTLLMRHLLCSTELVITAPYEWETTIEQMGWEDLARLPWIYSDGYCPFQAMIDGMFTERGLTYKRSVQSNDEMTKAELIAAGVGLTLLEKSEALEAVAQQRAAIYYAAPMLCDLSLVYAKHRQHEPLVKAITKHVLTLWGK